MIRFAATCVCGADLWAYWGVSVVEKPTSMGHEYCGVVEEVGSAVRSVKRGQFVIDSFFASDDTCPNCQAGYQTSCQRWFAADAANVKPGNTVAIIAMSRHETRQNLAREFGATDIVTERGDDGAARIKDLTNGLGADSVLKWVGTQESMMQAIHSTRPGGSIGYVGVPHGVSLVFDLTLPLDRVAEAYQAMDTRRAIKALLQP